MKSNSQSELDRLADVVLVHRRSSLKEWWTAAEALSEARKLAEHGQWLPFLQRAEVDRRTASNMIRVLDSGLELATVSHLGGVRAALEYLKIAQPLADEHWRSLIDLEYAKWKWSHIFKVKPDGTRQYLDTTEWTAETLDDMREKAVEIAEKFGDMWLRLTPAKASA